MLVTLLGMVMLVRLMHNSKAWIPILVTLLGIVILVRLLQPPKVKSRILVTLSGMVMLVTEVFEYPKIGRDPFPTCLTGIPFTSLGITTAPPLPE